jgi:hypothetical protein
MILDGSAGLTTPGVVNTAGETIATTLVVTGVTTLTGGLNAALPVLSGGTGVTTSTGTGANVLGTSPTITGLTFTSAATAAPAFSAYTAGVSGNSIGTSLTKVTYDTEEFDTNNNFASSRFTPTVAGYYQINAQVQPGLSYCGGYIVIYKNGTQHKHGTYINDVVSFGGFTVSSLVSCNGTSDYIEIYALFKNAQVTAGTITFSYFNGFLARSA